MVSGDVFIINHAERLCAEDGVEWYHSSLALSCQPKHREVDSRDYIVSQIHFRPDPFLGYITPSFRKTLADRYKEKTILAPILVSSNSQIVYCWNHMLYYAESLDRASIRFGKNSQF